MTDCINCCPALPHVRKTVSVPFSRHTLDVLNKRPELADMTAVGTVGIVLAEGLTWGA